MSCLQVQASYPLTRHTATSNSLSQPSYLRASCSYPLLSQASNHNKALPRLVCSMARYRASPAYLSVGRSKYESDDKVPLWNSIEKGMKYLRRGPSVHDPLKRQMTEQHFGGGGGSGRHWGSGGDGSGDEDRGFSRSLDELVQVILATLSSALLYFYLIRREEVTRLSSDYIKYLLGSKPSPRLRRAMHAWERFVDKIKGKEVKGISEDSEGADFSSAT